MARTPRKIRTAASRLTRNPVSKSASVRSFLARSDGASFVTRSMTRWATAVSPSSSDSPSVTEVHLTTTRARRVDYGTVQVRVCSFGPQQNDDGVHRHMIVGKQQRMVNHDVGVLPCCRT